MKVLIIDGNNLQHRAMHAYQGLTNNVKPVSIIYGMIQLTSHMIKQFRPDKVYICWDTARHKARLKLHPDYKGTRKAKTLRTPEEYANIEEQRKVVMKLYDALGVTQVIGPGMEADDWIYMLTRKYPHAFITIVSSDKDFNQLLGNRLKIWNPHKSLLIGKHNVRAHFGYSEKECIDYLSLVGDKGDNITGYRGMGEETTKIFLAEHGSIRRFLEDESLQFKRIDRTKLKEVYRLNKLLIGLKAFYLKYLSDTKLTYYRDKPKWLPKTRDAIFDEYNIQAFRKKEFLDTFKNLLTIK
jgi:DNA polymerase-1